MNKRVLIVGCKGFIGQHLTTYLLANSSYLVFGCDVVQDYNTPNYTVIDATQADFSSLFSDGGYDFCINCSGAANVSDSLRNPLRDYHLNTYNVFLLLDSIRRFNPTCRFINLSSAAVYGNPVALPITEDQLLRPTSPYGIHKMQAEQICSEFRRFYQIDCCSVRIFSAYGPGLRKQLFWDVYQKMANNSSVVLWGTGNESRDFIYIDDLVAVIERLMGIKELPFHVVNVGNGVEHRITSVVDTFADIVGFDRQHIKFSGEERKGDPQNWRADIRKLNDIGYVPSTDMKAGLYNYYEWLKTIN